MVETKELEYIDHPFFPASAPKDCPHILKSDGPHDEVITTDIRLCDAVATLLHKLEPKHPGLLTRFFDPAFKSVKILRVREQGRGDRLDGLLIWRRGSQVMTGFFEYDPIGIFDLIWATTCKSTIKEDRSWETIWAAWETISHRSDERRPEYMLDGIDAIHTGTVPFHNHFCFLDEEEEGVQASELYKVSRACGKAIWKKKLWLEHDDPIYKMDMVF